MIKCSRCKKEKDDIEFINICEQRGVDRNVGLMFLQYINNNPMWESSSETHIDQMLKQMHKHTWCSFEYLRGALYTTKGCLAGTPLADLMFCFLMIWYLDAVHVEADKQGIIPKVLYHEIVFPYPT